MIAKLTGTVDSLREDAVVLDVGGVGYLVFCSAKCLARLPPPGEPVSLLVETHVREDHIHLFGFLDEAEREWFGHLQSVQGVGARLAIAVLSALAPAELVRAIAAQDKAALAEAEGVGPKLAARIVNELREKAGEMPAAALRREPAASEGAAAAVSALVNLGYRRAEAVGAVSHAAQRLGRDAAVPELIKAGLQELGR